MLKCICTLYYTYKCDFYVLDILGNQNLFNVNSWVTSKK